MNTTGVGWLAYEMLLSESQTTIKNINFILRTENVNERNKKIISNNECHSESAAVLNV